MDFNGFGHYFGTVFNALLATILQTTKAAWHESKTNKPSRTSRYLQKHANIKRKKKANHQTLIEILQAAECR